MDIGFAMFISVFFAVGLGITGWGAYCVFKSQKAAEWPTVEGRINSCEIKEASHDEETKWRVYVNYSYNVFDQQHQGDRVAFGYSESSGYGAHASLHEKLSKARTVSVRYNPENPSESVLTYGLNRSTIMTLIFGLVWLVFTTGFTVIWTLSGMTDQKMVDRIEIREQKTAEEPFKKPW